jgi:8-oxo-dGTP pyrophosphatase MutT (NUDIX family)
MIVAAGLLIQAPDGRVLFLRRTGGSDEGMWAFPGGRQDAGETLEQTAVRETVEEAGVDLSNSPLMDWTRRQKDQVDYTTFRTRVRQTFTPRLNEEHDKFTWALPRDAPQPLHPGVKIALERFRMDELGVARAIALGELTSPQRYENMSLFALRITGTGVAYRQGLDEFVWRDPKIYLNEEFLARCAGLPVIVDHPEKNALDSQEFQDRIVGTILLPYIEGNEVWGVAKIFDDSTIKMLKTHQLSTSPAVVFRNAGSTLAKKLKDGKTLLIEGKPSLLDHLAICEQGVWDKGGEPTGVKSTLNDGGSDDMSGTMNNMAGGGAPKPGAAPAPAPMADADGGQQMLDKILATCDAMVGRIDALEKRYGDGAMTVTHDPEGGAPGAPVGGPGDLPSPKMDAGDEYPEEISTMPEATAADKIRKDSAKAGWRADKSLRANHQPARITADSVNEIVERRLAEKLKALEAKMPGHLSDADHAAMSSIQARADVVYAAFGDSAPRPLQGETIPAYRGRLAKGLQPHSSAWKDVDLSGLPENVLSVAEVAIYADAMAAARNPASVDQDELREVKSHDVTGRVVSTFVGQPKAWMQSFTANRRRVSGIRNGS